MIESRELIPTRSDHDSITSQAEKFLELLALRHPHTVPNRDIATALNWGQAKIFRRGRELVKAELVSKDGNRGYRLTPAGLQHPAVIAIRQQQVEAADQQRQALEAASQAHLLDVEHEAQVARLQRQAAQDRAATKRAGIAAARAEGRQLIEWDKINHKRELEAERQERRLAKQEDPLVALLRRQRAFMEGILGHPISGSAPAVGLPQLPAPSVPEGQQQPQSRVGVSIASIGGLGRRIASQRVQSTFLAKANGVVPENPPIEQQKALVEAKPVKVPPGFIRREDGALQPAPAQNFWPDSVLVGMAETDVPEHARMVAGHFGIPIAAVVQRMADEGVDAHRAGADIVNERRTQERRARRSKRW